MKLLPSDFSSMKLIFLLFSVLVSTSVGAWLDQRHAAPSSVITTAQPMMSVSTTPSVVNPLAQEPQCVCDASKVWVDVILAFDSSINAAPTKEQFVEHHSRIGVISYGHEAHLNSYLGEWNDDDFLTEEVTYTQDKRTNISDALQLAMEQFNTSNHRDNVRPVIVLVANTFTDGEVSPLAQATEFKNNGGIIVVYYFNPFGISENEDVLQQIASPGYFIYYSNEPHSQSANPLLVTAMCDANCFCPNSYVTPMSDPVRGYPIAGCYSSSVQKANEVIARNTCQSKNNGFVTTAKYQEKSQYLESLVGKDVKFWLGLTYDKFSNKYFWADNVALNTTATAWHPFANNMTSKTQSCVFEESMTWKPVDCKISYSYLCEAKPCSSKTYCH